MPDLQPDTHQQERLTACEAVIRSGLKTFIEVGRAIAEIKNGALYKQLGYDTWSQYCQERWGFTTQHAGRLARAAEVVRVLQIASETEPVGSLPASEWVARPLLKVPERDRVALWQLVLDSYGEHPSASEVQAVVDDFYGEQTEPVGSLSEAQPSHTPQNGRFREAPPSEVESSAEPPGPESVASESVASESVAPESVGDTENRDRPPPPPKTELKGKGKQHPKSQKPKEQTVKDAPPPKPNPHEKTLSELDFLRSVLGVLYSITSSIEIDNTTYSTPHLESRTGALLDRLEAGLRSSDDIRLCPPTLDRCIEVALSQGLTEDDARAYHDARGATGWTFIASNVERAVKSLPHDLSGYTRRRKRGEKNQQANGNRPKSVHAARAQHSVEDSARQTEEALALLDAPEQS